MTEQPSYYAIIPANVRYDKRLRANEKLLYAEITALSNKTGQCWASNGYFSDLYGVSKVSISNWIKDLVKYGYLANQLIYRDGTKEIEKRVLKIISIPNQENFNTPIKENFNTPIKEKFKDNTTSINTTSINKYIGGLKPTDVQASKKPEPPYEEIIDYLNKKSHAVRGYDPTKANNKKVINARFREGYTLEDFKLVIDNKVEDWLYDKKMSKYLKPSTLFSNKFEGYLNEQHKPLTAKEKDWGY